MVTPVSGSQFSVFDFSTYSQPLPPGSSASSGQICQQTGVWQNRTYQVVVGVAKGEVMPEYQNRKVEWELTGCSLSELTQQESQQ